MTDAYRPLSPMEFGRWFMDFAARSNFMVVAEFDGRISEPTLNTAAKGVLKRLSTLPDLREHIGKVLELDKFYKETS